MRISKSAVALGALMAVMAAGTLATNSARAETTTKTYVVCNRYDECWRVHERYTTYPADLGVTWHDDTWYGSHQHDAHLHWLNDPADDHGWYDKDGTWHAFADVAPPEH